MLLQSGTPFRDALHVAGVTQRELGDAVGILPQRVNRILRSAREARKQGLALAVKVYRLGCRRLGIRPEEVPELQPLLEELTRDRHAQAAGGAGD